MQDEAASDPARKRRSCYEGLFPVRVRLLGGFGVWVGPLLIEEYRWRLRKARSLIKLLALASGHHLHREQVMEVLWPELGVHKASNNLHQILHAARRALEPSALPSTSAAAPCSGYLLLRDEQLTLCADSALCVDVEAFEEAAVTARHGQDPGAYRTAIDHYSGELLPEDRYEVWLEERRAHLRELYLSLLLELGALYEDRREFEKAIEELGRVVTQEPTHEEAHVGLMRLYALSGRRREAFSQYERFRETLVREFGTEPEASTRHLQQQIWAGTFPHYSDSPPAGLPLEEEGPSPAGAARHNLPLARTSFVGREQEKLEVKRLLAMTRLLTLTGAGGCGKTRLTLEVARELVGAYPDGVSLVSLAPLSEAELVPQAVVQAVGVREQPGRALLETLKGTLRSRKMLLVLDNCEHLLEAVVGLVDALLDCCPHLRILATSRVTLNAAGEVNWVVPSLTVPSLSVTDSRQEAYKPQELEGYESVRLFVARSRQRVPSFVLTLRNRQAVAQICRQLDGIPLAIELAAARMGTLSAQELAERLDDSLKLLTGGSRTADPRQRSLRATLEWSFKLLSKPEQVLFRRFSVFAGGWTLEAAEEVCSGEGIEEGEVLDLLSKLVEKSLVVTEAEHEEGASRYRMLEPVRQYAHEKVEEIGESEAVSRQHAEYFLALAEVADPQLKGAEQEEWLKRLEQEHDNLRAALSWALEQGKAELGLRLSGALGDFWYMHGHLSEGQRWLEAGLAQSGTYSDSARAKALLHAGHIASMLGDYESSVALSEESLALSRKCGDKASSATALYVLSLAALFRNELERASTLAKNAVALKREINDRVGMVRSLLIPGLVAVLRHDYEGAMALHEESLDLAREVEDGFAIVVSLLPGALASLGRGDHRQTRALCDEGLKLCRHLGVLHGTASLLHIAASLAGAERQPVRSAQLWGAAETLYNEMGGTLSPAECQLYGPYIYAARALLDEVAWEAALAEGRAMSTGEAVEYALLEEDEEHESSKLVPAPEQQPPAEEPTERLTPREQEIALLVGGGLTNRQIAKELSISDRTVENHIANILRKQGFSSRARIATWVAQR